MLELQNDSGQRPSVTAATLRYPRHRDDPSAWARALNIPQEAVTLYLDSHVVDLHVDSFLWERFLPGYRIDRRHRPWLPGSAFLNQADLPRVREAQMAAIVWDVVTHPWLPGSVRLCTTFRNLSRMQARLEQYPNDFKLIATHQDFIAARNSGLTASFGALQGGQALEHDVSSIERLPAWLLRITLVHLTRSKLGASNARPKLADERLTPLGHEFVAAMQQQRILIDLAHINRRGFFDVVEATAAETPLVITHTGVAGVRPPWRNVDDAQLRAIADRGGTIGILFHPHFLADTWFRCPLESVVDHLQHIVDTVGEDHASIGSDFDGMILLPSGLRDVTELPRLVAAMLDRGWSDQRIRKILGMNALRVIQTLRP